MKYFFVAIVSFVLLTSCSKTLTPFTQSLVKQNSWTQAEVERIQFYTSEDIILTRELSSSDADIRNGKIKMENGVRIEEVLIEKGTPGVVVTNAKGSNVGVSFEGDRDDLYLMWGPNPKFRNQYMLLFKERNRRATTVTYDNKSYRLRSTPSVRLLVDLDRNKNIDKDRRKAAGRKVD